MPPDLASAYGAALSGPPAGAPPPMAPPPQMPPDATPAPRVPANVNPMTQQGDTFFLDPGMFENGEKCEVGDEVMLKATIQSKGSKIGLTPVEIVMEAESPEEEAGEGDEGSEGDKQPV